MNFYGLEHQDRTILWKVKNPIKVNSPIEAKSKTLLLSTPAAKESPLQIAKALFYLVRFSLCTIK